MLLALAVGIALAVALGVFLFRELVPTELAGVTTTPNEGRGHVAPGETVVYATATPTSGTHNAGSGRCGIFTQQVPLELAVHALEHGSVVIWYQPDIARDAVPGLRTIVDLFDDRVILSPNSELSAPVVATAWNRLKAYDGADPEIEDFIEIYRARGPESVACPY